MSQPLMTCDLDSTLCDTSQRRHLIKMAKLAEAAGDLDLAQEMWLAHAEAAEFDIPVTGVVVLLQALAVARPIGILSGRAEESRKATEKWFTNHLDDVHPEFLLLDDGTCQANPVGYKVRRMKQVLAEGWDVQLHLDDWQSVCDAITAETGVPTLKVWPAGIKIGEQVVMR